MLAFIISFLFMPLHECVHGTAFRSFWLNVVVAHACALLTSRPAGHYRYYHYAHHRFTGDARRDPELQNTILDMDITTYSGYMLYLSGLPFWLGQVIGLVQHSRGVFAPSEFWLSTHSSRTIVQRYLSFFASMISRNLT